MRRSERSGDRSGSDDLPEETVRRDVVSAISDSSPLIATNTYFVIDYEMLHSVSNWRGRDMRRNVRRLVDVLISFQLGAPVHTAPV